jgi:polysaccharide export outer membrane protein
MRTGRSPVLCKILIGVICAATVAALSLSIYGHAEAQSLNEYRLGSGDKVRVTVFGEPDLSGEFEIDGSGQISMPLVGTVSAGNATVIELESKIAARLLDGYLKDPKVSIEVLNYRPFYILGEVNQPGSYPFRAGMTVLNAVVMGGGYTYRADEDDITISREGSGSDEPMPVQPDTPVLPGDVIRIEERFF